MIQTSDFITQAVALLRKEQSTEVDSRSAISRAYYSLYHESFKFLVENYKDKVIDTISDTITKSTKEKSDFLSTIKAKKNIDYEFISSLHVPFHTIIPNTILRIDQTGLGWDYKKYHKMRCKADYAIRTVISHRDAMTIVQEINDLIDSIKRL